MTITFKKNLIILLCAVMLCAFIVPSVAWFARTIKTNPEGIPSISGSTAGSYFESGEGSAELPYIISQPVHLYNLAWLQYIGYFNLGAINNGRSQSYFKLSDDLSALDMSGLALPPIGTTQYPFLGSFDGNGKVITNLTVSNVGATLKTKPVNASFAVDSLLSKFGVNAEAVEVGQYTGFFGVVGDYDGAISKVTAASSSLNLTGDLAAFSQEAISAKNTGITAYTLENGSSATTIGFVAGYVNASLTNILVNDCNLTTVSDAAAMSPTTNLSDHVLVGYCEEAFEKSIYVKEVSVSELSATFSADINGVNSGGTDTAWGGSVAMKDLYTDLSALRDDPTTAYPNYAYTAVKVTNSDGTAFCAVDREITTGFMFADQYGIKDQHSVAFSYGSLFLEELTMLSGGAMINGTVVCTQSTNTVTAHHIKYGDGFLNVEVNGGEPTISLGNNESLATKWVLSNGKLAVITNGIKLYLNVSETDTDIEFTIDPNSATSNWSYVDTVTTDGTTVKAKGLCYTSGSKKYYFKLVNGEWKLREETDASVYYVIKSGTNYLKLTNEHHRDGVKTGTYTTSNADDTQIPRWYIQWSDIKSGYSVYAYTDKEYYLFQYDVLVGNPNSPFHDAAIWTYNNNRLTLNGMYLAYLNNTWKLSYDVNDAATVEAITPTDTASLDWSRSNDLTVNDVTIGAKSENITYEFGVANKYDATYIPLQTNDNHTANQGSNTGYLTGGMYNPLYGSGIIKPPDANSEFDVWISECYKQNIETIGKVYALVWENGVGSFEQIDVPTAYVDGKPSAELTDEAVKLAKYADSVYEYYKLINLAGTGDGLTTRLFGLQFIEGTMASRITVPEAYVNGTRYENYEVPSDCIDFNVKQKGYINFYAGTYYPGTSCFFSLHQVIRYTSSDTIPAGKKVNDIKEIKEIKRIYSVAGQSEYVYLYDTTTAAPANGTLIFDTSWLTENKGIEAENGYDNGFYSSDIQNFRGETYYFEIPVNAGEYALGSVGGKKGATLLYLDIGASMQDAPQIIDRTIVNEVFTESSVGYEYSDGVFVLDGSTYAEIASGEYLSLTLDASGNSNNININRAGNTLTVEGATSLNAVGGLSVTDGTDLLTPTPNSRGEVIVTKRVTYIDVATSNGTITKTVITFRDTNGDGNPEDEEVTIAVTQTVGDTVTALDTPTLTHSGTKTSFTLLTKPTGDEIDWSTIVASEKAALSYTYTPPNETTNVINEFVFETTFSSNSLTSYTYAVTITSTADLTVTITGYKEGSDSKLSEVTVNGATIVEEGDTVEVAASSG